jgi:hypothetical protein
MSFIRELSSSLSIVLSDDGNSKHGAEARRPFTLMSECSPYITKIGVTVHFVLQMHFDGGGQMRAIGKTLNAFSLFSCDEQD